MKKNISSLAASSLLSLMLFVLPASTNYQLHDFGFGSGGDTNLSSTNYALTGQSGELSAGSALNGTTYDLGAGLTFTRQANVPAAPTFTNPDNYYNRLHFVIDNGDNPSDATFAIAISTDNFTTTQYVQSDNTIGNTLGSEDYQTYANWGSGSGEDVIGLSPNTTYYLKVKAFHDSFTETQYSEVDTAATIAPSLTFDIDVSSIDEESGSPYTISLGTLTPSTVITGTSKIWVDISTNGEGGGFVYAYGTNGGLRSTAQSYTITSASTNLSSAQEGFGLQSNSVTQTSGGPLTAVSPYNGASENVGAVSTSTQTLLNTTSSPITGGRGAFLVKAKSSTSTPSAGDYSETITVIASATF